MHKLLLIVMVLLPCLQLEGKKTDERLLYNTPSDSLVFMLYINSAEVQDERMLDFLKSHFSEKETEVLSQFSEVHIYAQSKDRHMVFTLNFKVTKNIDLELINKMLNSNGLSVQSFDGNFVTLQSNNNEDRFGYFYMGNKFATIRLMVPSDLIDDNLRAEYELLQKNLTEAKSYEKQNEIYEQMDSVYQVDRQYMKPIFAKLIDADKQRALNGEDIQGVKRAYKFKHDIENNPLVMYFNNHKIWDVTYFGDKALGIDIYEGLSRDYAQFERGMQLYQMFDETWYSIQMMGDEAELVQLSSNIKSRHKLYTSLDSKMLQYLPNSDSTSVFTYGINAVELKEALFNLFVNAYDNNDEIAIAKLALLAIDDEVIEILNSFLISGDIVGSGYSKELHFRAVLKMVNQAKGRTLLNIMSKDLNMIEEIRENEYVIRDHNIGRKPIYLVIDNEFWIAGTDEKELLLKKNKKYKSTFPELANNKLAVYGIVLGDVLDAKKDLEVLKMKLEIINSKTVKSTVQFKLAPGAFNK